MRSDTKEWDEKKKVNPKEDFMEIGGLLKHCGTDGKDEEAVDWHQGTRTWIHSSRTQDPKSTRQLKPGLHQFQPTPWAHHLRYCIYDNYTSHQENNYDKNGVNQRRVHMLATYVDLSQ